MPPISASVRASALRNVAVLTLDNDKNIAHIVRDVLSELGFQKIFVGHDGSEGLRIMEKQPIDLIISDWDMEPMNGIDFVQHIRNNAKGSALYVPIILLTGKAEADDVQFARDAGITEFVVKPFTVKRLVDRIIAVIENPRSFVLSPDFKGPDRRRREASPPTGVDRRSQDNEKKKR